MLVLGGLCLAVGCIIGLVCGITILIDAFKNAVWKGLLYFFCGFYALYYMFAEFQHEQKTKIILGGILGPLVGWVIFFACGTVSGGFK